jgi:tRNA (guanosine-2'-O-)-methyltransferase
MRSCEIFGIQELNVIEQRYGKSIDKEIAMGPKWVDINTYDSITTCVDTLKKRKDTNHCDNPMRTIV